MKFGFPLGFWLGIAGAGVLLAHLVRRRARRLDVPFLPLWAAARGQMRGGFGASVSRWLDLLLVLLAVAGIALAAARPFQPGHPSTVRDLVLVIDGGLTAQAGDRLDRLRAVARAEAARRAEGARAIVIRVTDEGPAVWTGPAENALVAIAGHEAGWTDVSADSALRLGVEAGARLRDADHVFVTHRPAPQVESRPWRRRTVVVPVVNAGIESIEVLRDPEGGGYLARVGCTGPGEEVVIENTADGSELARAKPGEDPVRVPLGAGGDVTLRVRLPDEEAVDGFAPDDEVTVRLPEPRTPRVVVVAAGEPSAFLVAALEALASIGAVASPLERVAPEHAGDVEADVLIFDRCAPPRAIAFDAQAMRPRLVFFAPPASAALPFEVGDEGPAPELFELARGHRVMRGIEWTRIRPVRARSLRGGSVLARSGPGAVIAAGPHWIAVGFNPSAGAFASSPAFPLFLRNAVAAPGADAGAVEFARIGAAAPVAPDWLVRREGRLRAVGRRLLGPPGVWTWSAPDGSSSKTLPVNLLVEGLDLSPAADASAPLATVGEPPVPDRPLTAPFAAAALAALVLAWYAFWR